MRWSERKEDGVAILHLKGKTTIGPVSLRDLVRDLIARGEKKILLNMKDLTYICSSGIRQDESARGRTPPTTFSSRSRTTRRCEASRSRRESKVG